MARNNQKLVLAEEAIEELKRRVSVGKKELDDLKEKSWEKSKKESQQLKKSEKKS